MDVGCFVRGVFCPTLVFVTFENEVWCVQTPGAFLYESLLASFCLQYMSDEFFDRPCNFHFNILSNFEIIAKTNIDSFGSVVKYKNKTAIA